MNPEIKARWVAALRSGKYKQSRLRLSGKNGYCCLGVLCEIAVADGVIGRVDANPSGSYPDYLYGDVEDLENRGYLKYDDVTGQRTVSDVTLPHQVIQWAGLAENNPEVGDHRLATYNDGDPSRQLRTHSFVEIADLIEEHL